MHQWVFLGKNITLVKEIELIEIARLKIIIYETNFPHIFFVT